MKTDAMTTDADDYDLSTLKELLPLWVTKQFQFRRAVSTYFAFVIISALLLLDTSFGLSDVDKGHAFGMDFPGFFVLYGMSAMMWVLFILCGSSFLKQLGVIEIVEQIELKSSPSRRLVHEWYRDAHAINVFHDLFSGDSPIFSGDMLILIFYLIGIAVGQYLTILVSSSLHFLLSISIAIFYVGYYAVFWFQTSKMYPVLNGARYIWLVFVFISILANGCGVYQYWKIDPENLKCGLPIEKLLSKNPYST